MLIVHHMIDHVLKNYYDSLFDSELTLHTCSYEALTVEYQKQSLAG